MALFPTPGGPEPPSLSASAAKAAPWIQGLARMGYAARGVVYLVVGGIAVQAALSYARRPEDSSGALLAILRQPFGRVLLGVLVVGLGGFVLWRLVQAFGDPEKKGTSAKGLARRAGYLISALLHAGLALEAVRLLRGSSRGGGGGEQSTDHWTAVAMAQPAGRWIVGAVGAGVVLFGLYELYRAFAADLASRLDLSRLGPDARRRVVRFGRFGRAARGVVFGIIGWFLVRAALEYDASEARGFASALRTLEEQAYGSYLLGAVALGLIAFGLFELAEARYRVIRAP